MENNIKSFSLFVRPDKKSEKIANKIRQLNSHSVKPLQETENGDLVLAIGGDGTFLKAVNATNFCKKKIYAGIHTGTLGFLQDLSERDIYTLIQYLNYEKELRTRRVSVLTISVHLRNKEKRMLKAFNEVLICGKNYTKIQFGEYIGNELLQDVSGTGIIIASCTGDTAYSSSAGGAIIFSEQPLLCCSLLAPIKNSAYEDYLSNPVICHEVMVMPKYSKNIQIIVDGEPKEIPSEQIKSIEVSMLYGESYINKLELCEYSKVRVVRDKILGYNS